VIHPHFKQSEVGPGFSEAGFTLVFLFLTGVLLKKT